ncbi:MAG: DNA translocase FtsK [Muribaculaceae bacterium]|nr:DNA translocase FtsK [Muribaculaceae bacterium]
MRRYETFNPAIPEEAEKPISEGLPPFEQVQEKKDLPSYTKTISKNKKSAGSKRKVKEKEKKSDSSTSANKVVGFFTSRTFKWIIGLFLALFAVYLGIAFISYFASNVKDQSEINNTPIGYAGAVANAAGEGGARLSEFLINEFFGLGSFVVIIWLLAVGLRILSGRPKFKMVNFTIKCLVALITVSLIVGLLTIGLQSPVNWGGYHGRYVNEFIVHFVGWSGAVILCIFMLSCFVLICMRDVIKWIMKHKANYDEKRRIRRQQLEEQRAREAELEAMRKAEDHGEVSSEDKEEEDENKTDKPFEMIFGESDGLYTQIPDLDETEFTYNLEEKSELKDSKDSEEMSEVPESDKNEDQEKGDSGNASEIAEIPQEHQRFLPPMPQEEQINPEEKDSKGEEEISKSTEEYLLPDYSHSTITSDKIEDQKDEEAKEDNLQMVVNVNNISEVKGKSNGIGIEGHRNFPYNFPSFELLAPGAGQITVDPEEQLANKERIKRTLLDFEIPIVSIEATVGPTVTLYEIVPDKGIRVQKIRSLVDDIALSLAAEGIRIIAPIPGKGTVGIEVANKDKHTVSMRTVLKSPAFQQTKYKLPIAMGSTISNEVFIADLAKMPHLLVAGATGQGKSVGLNTIITSLLYSKRPDELKFVMIDPKMVEFSPYAKIEGHYLAKLPDAEQAVITNMDKVVETLNSLCIEMDNRYMHLKDAVCKNIVEYNEKIKDHKLNPAEGHKFLPYIVVIVDEYGDLIMTAGKDVETPIARLAQKARAVGMHVIIATQRPSANVITGIIKANFPARMAFKVTSGIDSKTILDTTGAQQLIGRGDMLVSNNGPLVRVQCAFIDTPEVEEITEYISRQPYQQGAYLLPEPPNGKGEDADGMGPGISPSDRDPLFEEVARLVVQTNNASTSSIQRRYRIGYNRAGSIMDQLENAGIVGPAQGGKPRSVLMDAHELEMLLENL